MVNTHYTNLYSIYKRTKCISFIQRDQHGSSRTNLIHSISYKQKLAIWHYQRDSPRQSSCYCAPRNKQHYKCHYICLSSSAKCQCCPHRAKNCKFATQISAAIRCWDTNHLKSSTVCIAVPYIKIKIAFALVTKNSLNKLRINSDRAFFQPAAFITFASTGAFPGAPQTAQWKSRSRGYIYMYICMHACVRVYVQLQFSSQGGKLQQTQAHSRTEGLREWQTVKVSMDRTGESLPAIRNSQAGFDEEAHSDLRSLCKQC